MDKEKEIELINLYQIVPEYQLLDLLSGDEKEFEEGVYEILVKEAKRRGIEHKVNEIKKKKEERLAERKLRNYEYQKILTTPKIADLPIIKSRLDKEQIPYCIEGEDFGHLDAFADGFNAINVLVREDQAEAARAILKDIITRIQLEEKEYHEETAAKKAYRQKLQVISALIFFIVVIGSITIRNYSIKESLKNASRKGMEYHIQGKFDEAIAEYNKALKIKPDLAVAYLNRGLSYAQKGDYYRAFLDFDEAISLDPKYSRAYSALGNLYNRQGRYELAIDNFSQAIELNPNDVYSYRGRGLAYGHTKQLDLAIADYTKTIEINANDAAAYLNRGTAHVYMGNYDQAIEDFNSAIKINPDGVLAYNNRGWAFNKKGNFILAISDFNQAIALFPRLEFAYYNRGLAYYNTKQYDRALSDYITAIGLEPNKEMYEEFLKDIPLRAPSDKKDVRNQIIELFKTKLTLP
jgi:tetratricopeptide (TPR) repeat protein